MYTTYGTKRMAEWLDNPRGLLAQKNAIIAHAKGKKFREILQELASLTEPPLPELRGWYGDLYEVGLAHVDWRALTIELLLRSARGA